VFVLCIVVDFVSCVLWYAVDLLCVFCCVARVLCCVGCVLWVFVSRGA